MRAGALIETGMAFAMETLSVMIMVPSEILTVVVPPAAVVIALIIQLIVAGSAVIIFGLVPVKVVITVRPDPGK